VKYYVLAWQMEKELKSLEKAQEEAKERATTVEALDTTPGAAAGQLRGLRIGLAPTLRG
jgi:hypothetical protein